MVTCVSTKKWWLSRGHAKAGYTMQARYSHLRAVQIQYTCKHTYYSLQSEISVGDFVLT
jgi:hypothetical protein